MDLLPRLIGHSRFALAELDRCAGAQFDQRVVDAFTAVLDRSAAPTG